VFADEFEEFEEMAERKFITCWKSGYEYKYSTDGINLYDKYNDKISKQIIDRKRGSYSNEVTKKPDELKFIVKSWGCTSDNWDDNTPCASRKLGKYGTENTNELWTNTWFIDFDNANMIFKRIVENAIGPRTETINYTCVSGNN
tara:strand:+ start:4750 stop:5181 length:432 start_codon:yes stop_codon:yes gene_type:complete